MYHLRGLVYRQFAKPSNELVPRQTAGPLYMDKSAMVPDQEGKIKCPWCPKLFTVKNLQPHMMTNAHKHDRKEKKVTVLKWLGQDTKDKEAADKQNAKIAETAADSLSKARKEMRIVGPNEHGQLDATRKAIDKFAKKFSKQGQPEPSLLEQRFKKHVTSDPSNFNESDEPVASTSKEPGIP